MIQDFFAALVPIAIFGIIFGTVLGFRYMKHREMVKMIEHGYPPEMLRMQERSALPNPSYTPVVVPHRAGPGRGQLVGGCVLAGIGLALTIALWPLGFVINSTAGVAFPLGIGPWMVAGFIPLFVGLALILTYVVVLPGRDVVRNGVVPPMPPAFYHAESFVPPEAMSFTVRPPESREG